VVVDIRWPDAEDMACPDAVNIGSLEPRASNVIADLKALEQKEANTPKRNRKQELIKLRTEIDQEETKKSI
jgi:hypothetical protein